MKIKIINLKKGKNCKIIEPVNIYGATLGDNVFVDTAGAQFQTYIQSIRTINWENCQTIESTRMLSFP